MNKSILRMAVLSLFMFSTKIDAAFDRAGLDTARSSVSDALERQKGVMSDDTKIKDRKAVNRSMLSFYTTVANTFKHEKTTDDTKSVKRFTERGENPVIFVQTADVPRSKQIQMLDSARADLTSESNRVLSRLDTRLSAIGDNAAKRRRNTIQGKIKTHASRLTTKADKINKAVTKKKNQ